MRRQAWTKKNKKLPTPPEKPSSASSSSASSSNIIMENIPHHIKIIIIRLEIIKK